MEIKRGEIYFADLSPTIGSEQSGIRPVVIVQNDIGNKYSPTVIVVAITSKIKNNIPTHIKIDGEKFGLCKDSVILTEQIRTIDKSRLKSRVGKLDEKTLKKVKEAIIISCDVRSDIKNILKLL
ncbi:MAG: type II toxin-antitoxin system PemK/MazF family toxin [Clostridia bacterium]|nr:type II toxin-antitoxin system PemK/MazF family toxin [Clostridia bacterium]